MVAEGLVRGQKVVDTGSPTGIQIPACRDTLGRITNAIGEPIDERGPTKGFARKPIHGFHADPPAFVDQLTTAEAVRQANSNSQTCPPGMPNVHRRAPQTCLKHPFACGRPQTLPQLFENRTRVLGMQRMLCFLEETDACATSKPLVECEPG